MILPLSTSIPGAGFFISSDGYILTNAHVAQSASRFEIVLYDGRRTPARVIGIVESRNPDVGVLKANLTAVPPAIIADADPQIGETLLAMGHPFGYGYWIVAGGKLARLNEKATARGAMRELITTIPGAPGNSGGPLFNLRAEVVGLVFGSSSSVPAKDVRASPFTVIWSWDEFQNLKPEATAAIAISQALEKAKEIIEKQANVP